MVAFVGITQPLQCWYARTCRHGITLPPNTQLHNFVIAQMLNDISFYSAVRSCIMSGVSTILLHNTRKRCAVNHRQHQWMKWNFWVWWDTCKLKESDSLQNVKMYWDHLITPSKQAARNGIPHPMSPSRRSPSTSRSTATSFKHKHTSLRCS